MRRGHLRLDGGRPIWVREGAVAVEREAKSGILDKSRRVAVAGIQVWRSVAKARSLEEPSRCSRSPWKTRAGVTRHHLDSAIDALADRNNKPRERACANRRGT